MKKVLLASAVITATVFSSGCAPRIGGDNYSVVGAGEVNTTHRGSILAMRPVTISASSTTQDNQPGAGALIGATTGAVLGSSASDNALVGLAGAVVGGVAGHYAGRAMTDQEGFEYQVQLDYGELVTIAQGAEPKLSVGQRVLVVRSAKSRGRILPDNTL